MLLEGKDNTKQPSLLQYSIRAEESHQQHHDQDHSQGPVELSGAEWSWIANEKDLSSLPGFRQCQAVHRPGPGHCLAHSRSVINIASLDDGPQATLGHMLDHVITAFSSTSSQHPSRTLRFLALSFRILIIFAVQNFLAIEKIACKQDRSRFGLSPPANKTLAPGSSQNHNHLPPILLGWRLKLCKHVATCSPCSGNLRKHANAEL